MNLKKRAPILIGTIIIMLIIIANAAYAYFATTAEIVSNLSFEALFNSTLPTFTSYVEKDLSLQVYTTDMLNHSDLAVKSANGIVKVDVLSSSATAGVICTYDIDLVWDSDNYVPSTVLPIQDEEGNNFLYELSLKATREITGDNGYTYQDKSFAETNLNNITFTTVDGEKRAKLIRGAEIHNQSDTDMTSTTWTITLSFYSLPTSQNTLLGKSFSGHLVVTNAIC